MCFEDNTCITVFENGTELHSGQGLNPKGSVPLKPQNTYVYPNGITTTSADNVTVASHQCFEDFRCVTTWSNGQVDKSRNSTEGPILEIQELGDLVL